MKHLIKLISILKILKALSKQEKDQDYGFTPDFENDTCILFAFISHGSDGCVKMKEDQINVETDILRRFRANNCPGLGGKPKIFLFSVSNFFYKTNLLCFGRSRTKTILVVLP